MTKERKQEIIKTLLKINDDFEPDMTIEEETNLPKEPVVTMFGLISRYNATGGNIELIGGDWVIENCSEPLNLLS